MFPYEKLDVYKKAFEANKKLYRFIKENTALAGYVKSQLGRAGLSILLNIPEGSAKYNARDRRNFFVIARGSAFECSALIAFLYDEGELLDPLRSELYFSLDEVSRMLYTMIQNLEKKNTC